MFKNDRMMLILTALVLAIFAGSMVQYGDRIMALMSGEQTVATQDDAYSVRAGSSQVLDVLSNDEAKGPIVVLSRPTCGAVELTGNNRLSFSSQADCTGEVEFAYCVDSEGECSPKAVRINVISVAYAQENAVTPAKTAPASAQPSPEPGPPTGTANAANPEPSAPVAVTRAPATEAPEIATFAVEMAPPTLAAPSLSELVSPSVAVASIRQPAGGLNSSGNIDQNISTQNTASVGQTASSGPAGFAAPGMGESSNISLGGSERVIASNTTNPSTLQEASNGGSNITQLERGPEAMASIEPEQAAPTIPDSASLSTGSELSGFAPVTVASAQTDSPTPDERFSAAPVDGGPIALIALNRTETRGAAAGESLNIILTEPGRQVFSAPPSALAPASAQPQAVTVQEHAPNISERAPALAKQANVPVYNVALRANNDRAIGRSPLQTPTPSAAGTPYRSTGARVVASAPNMVKSPKKFIRHDTISRYISVGTARDFPLQFSNITMLSAPSQLSPLFPAIDLTPAAIPPVLQASLPATPQAPVATAPAQNSTCAITLSAQASRGAMISLDILSACKPGQMVTIEHAGLSFSVMTDAQGAARVQLPAMQADAEVTARFQDQSTASARVNVRDIDSVVRAGVSWQASMNLDLTAIEFGAANGTEGYISPQSPRDYRSSRVKGGGYLLSLGDPSLERGALAEVYTLPIARNQQRGTIELSIAIEDTAPVCGQAITAKTVRTRDGRNAGIRNVRFTVPECGTVTGAVALPGAIDDIRLAGR